MTDTVMLSLDYDWAFGVVLEYYGLPCHLFLGTKISFAHVCFLFICFSLLLVYHTILSIILGLRARKEV